MPLAIPLATLVFLAAFVPIIGSVVADAVLVALVINGFVTALIVLGIVIAVMHLESHILQPPLLSRAVTLYPLAVVLPIRIGVVVGCVAGRRPPEEEAAPAIGWLVNRRVHRRNVRTGV